MRFNTIIPMDIFDDIELEPGEQLEYITEDIVPGVYPYYMVSTAGRVYHRYLRRFMKPGLETSGYLFIILSTRFGPKIIQMNRLVLMRFNPIANPDDYQANHINGNKLNNHLYNLEWTTRSENIIHSYRTGLHIPKTSIPESLAIQVVELLKTNQYQCKEIAKMLGVNENIVNSIKKKESWKHLTSDCEFQARPGRLYTEEDVNNLCLYFQSNPKDPNIDANTYVCQALEYCGFQDPRKYVDTARKIYKRKYYTKISSNYDF